MTLELGTRISFTLANLELLDPLNGSCTGTVTRIMDSGDLSAPVVHIELCRVDEDEDNGDGDGFRSPSETSESTNVDPAFSYYADIPFPSNGLAFPEISSTQEPAQNTHAFSESDESSSLTLAQFQAIDAIYKCSPEDLLDDAESAIDPFTTNYLPNGDDLYEQVISTRRIVDWLDGLPVNEDSYSVFGGLEGFCLDEETPTTTRIQEWLAGLHPDEDEMSICSSEEVVVFEAGYIDKEGSKTRPLVLLCRSRRIPTRISSIFSSFKNCARSLSKKIPRIRHKRSLSGFEVVTIPPSPSIHY